MKVILLQDIEKLGKKFEVKEVKEGFARNFLFAKKLAKPATKKAVEQLGVIKEQEEKKAEEELKQIQQTASNIDGKDFTIVVKVGDKGELFEKISAQKILEKIKEDGYDIKKAQIDLKEPISELGEFPVKIKFSHNLESQITIIIAEKNLPS